MTNIKFLTGILLIGFVIGCDNGSKENIETDIWNNVINFSELTGTWKSISYHTINETLTPREYLEFIGRTWDASTDQLYGNMKINIRINNYSGIGFIYYDFIDDLDYLGSYIIGESSEVTYTFSGGNIDSMWESIKIFHSGADSNDSKYSITEYWLMPRIATEIIDEQLMNNIMENIKINQNRDKIRSSVWSSSYTIYIKD